MDGVFQIRPIRGKHAWFAFGRCEDGAVYLGGAAGAGSWESERGRARRFRRKAEAQEAIDALAWRRAQTAR